MASINEEKSWFKDNLGTPRRAQQSTVTIIEINDPPLQNELRMFGTTGLFGTLFAPKDKNGNRIKYEATYVWNLQRDMVKDYLRRDPITKKFEVMEWDDIPTKLDQELQDMPSVVIIEYVFTAEHVNAVQDFIAAIMQDQTILNQGSAVIVETASLDLFHPTVRSQCNCIIAPPMTEQEQLEFSLALAKTLRIEIPKNAKFELEQGLIQEDEFNYKIQKVAQLKGGNPELIQAGKGLNKGLFQSGLMESFLKELQFNPKYLIKRKIEQMEARGLIHSTSKLTFENIGAYEIYKNLYKNRIAKLIKNPQLAAKFGVRPPRGIIEVGPPGTGKTLFANALGNETGIPLYFLNAADYLSKYVGEAEGNLRRIFRMLNAYAPVILFIDEAEAILGDRSLNSGGDGNVTSRTLNMFLEELGNPDRQWICIIATNLARRLDKAATRAGRFDILVPRFLPDAFARAEVWRVQTSVTNKLPLANDIDVKFIVDSTWMWNCGEIAQLAQDSGINAIINNHELITMEDVHKAIKDTEVNIEARKKIVEDTIADIKSTERYDKTLLEQAIAGMRQGENEERTNTIEAMIRQI